MTTEDIAQDLEPEPASPGAAPERPGAQAPRGPHGHRPKIAAAVAALEAEGLLPEYLRPVTRDRRITDWLMEKGYAKDLPSRPAMARFFAKRGCNSGNSGNTVGAPRPDAA
ncbi:MAG TPA: hypothetical protein VGF29_20635 [Hyphomicrobiaceae bacterium]|jgi:hypothetical protein